jgi:hypothetical protein
MNPSAILTSSNTHPAAPETTSAATTARPGRLQAPGALLAGLVTIFALSHGTDAALGAAGIFPEHGQLMSDGPFLGAAVYRTAYGVLGCYLSARLAPRRPQAYALGLGGFGFVLSLLGVLVTWNGGPAMGPLWYPLALVATAIPAGWLGGRLLLWQQRRFRG